MRTQLRRLRTVREKEHVGIAGERLVAEHRERGRGVHCAVADRPVVVLHFLERDDVGRPQVVDDETRQIRERSVRRVEVLDIEGRGRKLARIRRCRRFALEAAGHAGEGREHLDHEVPEVVVDDAYDARREVVADVQV